MAYSRRRILWIGIGLAALVLLAIPKVIQGIHGKPVKTGQGPRGGSGTGGGGSGAGTGAAAGGMRGGSGGSRDGGPGGSAVQVTAHVVRPQKLERTVVSTGSLRAGDAVQLKSETSGRIVQLPFKEGARVAKGKLLVKINDADLRAQLLKARAALGMAQVNEQRERQLFQREFVSRQEYDQAREASASAKGDIELIEAQIAKTEIRAPFDGVVGLSQVSVGTLVSAGAPIANFVSDAPLKVDFAVPEQYYDSVGPGTKVSFTLQGNPKVYAAKVYAVDPVVDQATRTVNVRALCDGLDSALAPGTFARLSLVVQEKPQALAVPSQAVVPSGNGEQVYVLREGKTAAQPVRTGLRTSAVVEVVSGLNPGDTVITSGVSVVRPGSPVQIKSLD
ncbi:MAG: efflux RND transporter periplasmic adaptor subunit [Fibrobacteres bacterium]|nr:efflux RND transporter periplasmic adaptor subunit [Fibrobacterota bacterium]